MAQPLDESFFAHRRVTIVRTVWYTTSHGRSFLEFQQALSMSTNPNASHEQQALYQSMLRATWISAISALLAVIVAATASIYSIWQMNQLVKKSSNGEEIHEIASTTELLASLDSIRTNVMTTTQLAAPISPQLLILDQGNLSTASTNVPQVDAAVATQVKAFTAGDGLFALIDGHIIPLEVPLEMQSGNTEVVYLQLLSPESGESGVGDFRLESADYAHVTETTTMSPTQETEVQATDIDETQGQTFGISFETTKGTQKITIVTWYNY
jgi:hypothetical protein